MLRVKRGDCSAWALVLHRIGVVRGLWCCTGLGNAVQREREIDRWCCKCNLSWNADAGIGMDPMGLYWVHDYIRRNMTIGAFSRCMWSVLWVVKDFWSSLLRSCLWRVRCTYRLWSEHFLRVTNLADPRPRIRHVTVTDQNGKKRLGLWWQTRIWSKYWGESYILGDECPNAPLACA